MPLMDCSVDGEPGVKWGDAGTCYTYTPGDEDSRKDAVKQAMAQAIAIGDIDTSRGVTLESLEHRDLQADNTYRAPALIVTIGAPGAGKSSWIERHLPNARRVSLERIRREPDADRGAIINAAVDETFTALRNGELVVFDSTGILGQMRARLRGIARALDVEAHAVLFNEPLTTLLDAQRDREHPVPDERVRELYDQLQREIPIITTEDWASLRDIQRANAEEGGGEATYEETSVETTPTDTLDNERSYSPVAVEFRESGAGNNYKTLIGYPAVFNRMSEDLGGFREVIAPGAFTRALEQGGTIKLLYDHDTAAVLASTDNGTLELREDDIGLHMWARVDMDDPDVQRVSAKLRSGIVDQMSFAFTMGAAGEEDWDYSGGIPVRTIRAIESLPEVSVVSMPAYLDSKVALLERARHTGRLPELVRTADAAPDEVGGESPGDYVRGADPKTSAYWRAHLLKRKQEQNRWTS